MYRNAAIQRRFWNPVYDRLAPLYDAVDWFTGGYTHALRRRALPHLPPPPARVLEVGLGAARRTRQTGCVRRERRSARCTACPSPSRSSSASRAARPCRPSAGSSYTASSDQSAVHEESPTAEEPVFAGRSPAKSMLAILEARLGMAFPLIPARTGTESMQPNKVLPRI
jgi:hypothetical protein